MSTDLNLAGIKPTFTRFVHTLERYKILAFVLFVCLLYGFLVYRISTLDKIEPDQSEVTAAVQKTQTPKIDEELVQKIRSLEDNNINVRTLFEEARRNPFN